MDGVLIIDKPRDYTSRDVVNIVSKKLNTKKVGHTGTLDPLASGVLIVCINKATKLVDVLTAYEKEYIATVRLGLLTDTLDSTGKVIENKEAIVSKSDIINVLNDFKCKYLQEVPIYSAVKVNGKKLYEYARKNEDVILPKKEVEIKNIELLDDVQHINKQTTFKFKCTVSKGTYIRGLIRDIAYKLNTVGTMTSLIRTKQGNFDIKDCICIEQIDAKNIISIESIISIKNIKVDEKIKNKIINGQILNNIYNEKEILFIDENSKALAIYKVYEKDKTKIKPYKMFGGIK